MTSYSEFPESEYKRRYEKLVEMGQRESIEAFIFTDEVNLRYFAGGPLSDIFILRSDFIVLIVPTDITKEPALLLNKSKEGAAKPSWIKDKRFWADTLGDSNYGEILNMISKTIEEKRLANSKIAMETGPSERLFMPISLLKEIENKFPNIEIVPSRNFVLEIRAIKSKLEVDVIRNACEITANAIKRGIESIKEGVSEKYISRTIKSEMFKLGADSVPFLTVIAGWERGKDCDSHATDYEIKKGDVIQIDGGCSVKGYCSDMLRTAVLGYIGNTKYLELYKLVIGAHNACRSLLKNGVRIGDVCAGGRNYFIDNNSKDLLVFGVGQTGHGIGVEMREWPFLEYDSNKELKEGMVFTLEPAAMEKSSWDKSKFYTCLENDYVITSESYEQLTNIEEDITII